MDSGSQNPKTQWLDSYSGATEIDLPRVPFNKAEN